MKASLRNKRKVFIVRMTYLFNYFEFYQQLFIKSGLQSALSGKSNRSALAGADRNDF